MIYSKGIILSSDVYSTQLAIALATKLRKGVVISLSGPLGSGKTFICREIIRFFLGNNICVPSPTFNLLLTYETREFTIHHFDLYRLNNINEAYELAIEEAFCDGVSLIEWPELIVDILPKDTIQLKLSIKDNIRYCTITAESDILNDVNSF